MELIIHARSVCLLESFPALEVGYVLYVYLAVVLGGGARTAPYRGRLADRGDGCYAVEMHTLD